MQTGYQSQRGNCWWQVLAVVMLACVLGASTAESSFADPVVLRAAKQTIVEGTSQLSPPAIQFDEAGALHLAWFEKSGDVPTLKTVRVSDSGRVVGETVRVNPVRVEPDALHQAPGLAVGKDNHLFMTWSSARKGGMFATDLWLARSMDGGITFERPVLVNDDGQPINHSFESVLADRQGHVYLTWWTAGTKTRVGSAQSSAARGTTAGASALTVRSTAWPVPVAAR